jgi:hypothetical protein
MGPPSQVPYCYLFPKEVCIFEQQNMPTQTFREKVSEHHPYTDEIRPLVRIFQTLRYPEPRILKKEREPDYNFPQSFQGKPVFFSQPDTNGALKEVLNSLKKRFQKDDPSEVGISCNHGPGFIPKPKFHSSLGGRFFMIAPPFAC